jgi:hypothetical protein
VRYGFRCLQLRDLVRAEFTKLVEIEVASLVTEIEKGIQTQR